MEKNKLLISMGITAVFSGVIIASTEIVRADDTTGVLMYRLYNSNSGEHFYTKDGTEKQNLVNVGWKYEGIGWYAPTEGSPVYRLYNSNAGDHHYTLSKKEKDNLVKVGWKYEGIGWYSADTTTGEKLYRAYNPNARAGSHNYTRSWEEQSSLIKVGWKDEGIAWYGIKQANPTITGVTDTVLNQTTESIDSLKGVKATDFLGTTLKVTVSGEINYKVAGTYTLTYTAVDSYGNKATKTRKVTVNAVANPTITGVSDTTISQTTAAFDAKKGIVAKDSTGKEISYQVSGEVNTKKVGTYTLTYTAVDDYQNTTTITRNVSVTSANISKPVIEGVKDIEYKRSDHTDKESFKIDQTVTATDYAGRTIPVEASQSEVVNNPGEYKITYSAIDDFDQTTTVVQLVKILDDYPEKVEQGLIPLNGEYFDSNFETYLKDNYSKYISGQFLNALYINDLTINPYWKLPFDTLNFDYFKNLTSINIDYSHVKNINISNLSKLSEIRIFNYETTSITMDNLPELKKLTIYGGKISTSTNFESMTKITYMDLNNLTGLSKLDLRSLVNLSFVSITKNLELTTVEFGENTNVLSLDLSNNNISQLNIKGLRNLRLLDVSNNNLAELDISNNKRLTEDDVKIGNQAIGFKLIK